MLLGAFSLVAYASLADLATAGTLPGTNEQLIFDQLPTIALIIGVFAVGGFVFAASRVVFRRR